MNPDSMAKRMILRTHNRDGLPEIVVGLTLLIASGLIYLQVLLPRGSTGFKSANIAFTILIPALCLGASPALKWIRGRYLIDREGYVEHQPAPRTRMAVAAAIGIGLLPVLFFLEPRAGLLHAATGILAGVLMVMLGRLPRFIVGGVMVAAAGVSIGLAGVTMDQGFAMLFGFQGLLTLVSGSVVFARFMRQPA